MGSAALPPGVLILSLTSPLAGEYSDRDALLSLSLPCQEEELFGVV